MLYRFSVFFEKNAVEIVVDVIEKSDILSD